MNRKRFTIALLALALGAVGSPARATHGPEPRIDPGIVDATATTRVLARFAERVPSSLARAAGLRVLYRFRSLPAVYAEGTPSALRALAAARGLVALEGDHPIAYDLDSATVASGARAVWDGADVLTDGSGALVDGRGVGIAVVDSGLDGLHPDFQVPGKVGGNYLTGPAGVTPAPYTVQHQAHGTHVAGIAVGNGASSGGRYRGAAPGATLYSFGMYTGTVGLPSIAFDWIIQNGAAQTPPIRVVNNSWHCTSDSPCGRLQPERLHIQLASKMAESGIVVTWSAGNEGGDGFTSVTNPEAQNPTPGVIGVANYNDEDRGLVPPFGCLANSSSRGAAIDPTTWPDVAAPGQSVLSTWALGPHLPPGDLQNSRMPDGRNNYRSLNGTSMAAPHVAGIVALMLQVNPALRPGEVEYLLKATARKLDPGKCKVEYANADPAHTFDGANHAEGHGLVDARAAVQAAAAFTGVPPMPDAEALPESFLRVRVGATRDHTFYLRGDDRLSADEPTDTQGARVLLGDSPVTFTSDPLATETAADGTELGIFVGTSGELVATAVANPAGLQARVDRVTSAGDVIKLTEYESRLKFTFPGVPIYRKLFFTFERATFAPGDRLRLTLNLRSDLAVDDVKFAWILYADSRTTPSALTLGTEVVPVEPDSTYGCQVRIDCVEIGGLRRFASPYCGEIATSDDVRLRIRWSGPPGSSATYICQGRMVTCTVAGEPATDPWGTCEETGSGSAAFTSHDSVCFYRGAGGERIDGYGRCDNDPPHTGQQ